MTKTILLEIDVDEGNEAAVKELLAYLAYTKRIKKYLWREKDPSPPRQLPHSTAKEAPSGKALPDKPPANKAPAQAAAPTGPAPAKHNAPEKHHVSSQMMMSMLDSLAEWKKDNKLIRLKALKGKGMFLDIACKIVSYDTDTGIVTVYDVDRKVVETVRLTEIENMDLAL
jgi:pyruvate/2-oxoglutarate dehydrogenase complex dihydrolipoamide acyltransferase (E2) component